MILISAKTLFFIKTSYNVPVRNESISQSKICKKTHYFTLSLDIWHNNLQLKMSFNSSELAKRAFPLGEIIYKQFLCLLKYILNYETSLKVLFLLLMLLPQQLLCSLVLILTRKKPGSRFRFVGEILGNLFCLDFTDGSLYS